MLTVILAIARDGAIGHNGDLLWHLKADLRHFKELTMGHPVIMGRKTWESLPKGALPGRRNMVITRNGAYQAPGAEIFPSLDAALKAAAGQDAFIIGGAQLYRAAMPLARRLELTRVEAEYPQADTRMDIPFPGRGWILASETEPATDEKSGLTYRFQTYVQP